MLWSQCSEAFLFYSVISVHLTAISVDGKMRSTMEHVLLKKIDSPRNFKAGETLHN